METLIWIVVVVFGGAILWALLTQLAYQLARAARRGWEDEGTALRERQVNDISNETVV